MNGLKWTRLGAFAIAAGAAGLSYDHQKHLYETNAIGKWSYVVPLIVDVLALLAAVVRNVERVPPKLKRTATWTLAAAGFGSVAANVAVAINPVQVAVGIGTVGAYLLAENFVSAMAKAAKAVAAEEAAKTAVVMVAKDVADAALATAVAMAKATAATDMATAVAEAVAMTEQRVRAEAAELVAEAERATRDAAAAESAARAEAARVARERETAARLAAAEAERLALAEQLADAASAAAKVAAKPMAKPVTLAAPRVASGQASLTASAILATNPDMATEDVVAAAAAQGVELSTRTVRRVKLEMRMATAAA